MSDRFRSPSPPMEGYDRELLTVLIEECAEIQQRASKAIRFGINEIEPGQQATNRVRLEQEIGDLIEVVNVAARRKLLDWRAIEDARVHKEAQLAKYMQEIP